MKLFQSFEQWLCDRSWLIWGARIAVLWPLFFFWSLGFWGPVRQMTVEEIEYQRTRNPALEQQNTIALTQKADELLARAREIGHDYGPEQYFCDLRTLESQARKGRAMTMPRMRITQMQELMRDNCKPDPPHALHATPEELQRWHADPRKFTLRDISIQAEAHTALRGISDEDREEFRAEVRELGVPGIANWLLGIWLRGIPLMFVLYLLRMVGKRGILETILADKFKFWKAIVDWPVYMFQYPDNVVREIVVETELRRLGGLWRKLTFAEQREVRRIAASRNFGEELGSLQARLAPSYVRGFACALLATLFLMMFAPWARWARAERPEEESQGRAAIVFAHESRAGPIMTVSDQLPTDDWSGGSAVADLPSPLALSDPRIEVLVAPGEVRITEPPPDAIDHVPVTILGVNAQKYTLHQGDRDDEDHHVRGCRNPGPRLQLAVCS